MTAPITRESHCYIAVKPEKPDDAVMITVIDTCDETLGEILDHMRRGLVLRCVPIEEGRAAIVRGFGG